MKHRQTGRMMLVYLNYLVEIIARFRHHVPWTLIIDCFLPCLLKKKDVMSCIVPLFNQELLDRRWIIGVDDLNVP